MYKAFNLIGDIGVFSRWEGLARPEYQVKKDRAASSLARYVNHQALDGSRIADEWFGSTEADVFISHSHADQNLAIGLAGYLARFGISCFIDSLVWGNAVDLNREIDNKYCLSIDQKTYDYQKRNYSTSHVHMMLAAALVEMIDRCECVIFLNTPSSIDSSVSSVGGPELTASPWIYHELVTTKIIRKTIPARVRPSLESRGLVEASVARSDLAILYQVPLSHLINLEVGDLLALDASDVNGADALDLIYKRRSPYGK